MLVFEGTEEAVLRHFPFERFRFLTLSVEVPLGPDRRASSNALTARLRQNGYHHVRMNGPEDQLWVHESLSIGVAEARRAASARRR